MNNQVHFSSAKDDWSTPQWLFDLFDKYYHFDLDPCATRENAKCDKFFTIEHDGLAQDWSKSRVFMNPPYGRGIAQWVEKAANEAIMGALVVALLPSRTDTAWWHGWVKHTATNIIYIPGRLKFGDGKAPAPFPSAVAIYDGPFQNIITSLSPKNRKLTYAHQTQDRAA